MLKLQLLNIPRKEMPQSIIGTKTPNEKITLYELKHAFMRPPISFKKEDSKLLASYLIQPNEETPYDKFMRKKATDIAESLNSLIGNYYVYDATRDEKIKQEIVEKLSPFASQISKIFDQSAAANQNYSIIDTLKLCLQTIKVDFSDEYIQYMQMILYKGTGSVLPKFFHPVAELLKEESSQPAEKPEETEEYEEEPFEVDDNTNKIVKKEELAKIESDEVPKPTHSAPPVDMQDGAQVEMGAENPDELTNTNDKMLIELAQKSFMEISKAIVTKGISVRTLLSKYIETQKIGKDNVEVVSVNHFKKALKELGVTLEKQEIECITRVLCVNEENNEYLKLDDFEQIINEYCNPEGEENEDAQDINEESLVILLVLSNYISTNKLSLKVFLDPYINIQPIRLENGEEKEVEVIKLEDFNTIIESAGISMDPSELSNFTKLIAISEDHQDILKLSKLLKLLEQFEASEEMKSIAKQCYDQILKDQDGDKGDDGPAKEEEVDSTDQKINSHNHNAKDDNEEANYEEPNEQVLSKEDEDESNKGEEKMNVMM